MVEATALFDMDGTVADYDRVMVERMTELKAPEEAPLAWKHSDDEPPHLKARRRAVSRDPGFWRNLPEYEPGMVIWRLAGELGFQRKMLTQAPTSSPVAWTAKVEWVLEHLGLDVPITITRSKGDVFGRILVDDYPPYINAWLAHRHRGLVIMPAHPWNAGFEHPNVIRWDGTNLDEIRAAMIKARDRNDKEHWRED